MALTPTTIDSAAPAGDASSDDCVACRLLLARIEEDLQILSRERNARYRRILLGAATGMLLGLLAACSAWWLLR